SGPQFGVVYGQVGSSLVSSTAKWAAVWCRLRASGSQFGVVYGQVGRSLVSSTAKWVAVWCRLRPSGPQLLDGYVASQRQSWQRNSWAASAAAPRLEVVN
ncbi:hypothetical protein PF010_g24875, partial [Phytophthora fragariae]